MKHYDLHVQLSSFVGFKFGVLIDVLTIFIVNCIVVTCPEPTCGGGWDINLNEQMNELILSMLSKEKNEFQWKAKQILSTLCKDSQANEGTKRFPNISETELVPQHLLMPWIQDLDSTTWLIHAVWRHGYPGQQPSSKPSRKMHPRAPFPLNKAVFMLSSEWTRSQY